MSAAASGPGLLSAGDPADSQVPCIWMGLDVFLTVCSEQTDISWPPGLKQWVFGECNQKEAAER